MQVIAISRDDYARHSRLLDSMFRLRAKVFKDRLGWDIRVIEGRERDQYDRLCPTYIVALTETGVVAGSVRLLPALGPTMIANTFPQLLSPAGLGAHPQMIETSRFCVDTELTRRGKGGLLHDATLSMFAGIIEWSMVNGYDEIATVTDVRFERILKQAGWPLIRLGEPHPIGNTIAIAGVLSADQTTFDRLRPDAYCSIVPATRRIAA